MGSSTPRIALFLLFWASAKLISKIGHTNCDIDTYTPLSVAITDSTHRNLLCGLCTNTGLLLGNPTRKPANDIIRDIHANFITFLVLILSGDIQLNPGPKYEDVYSCGFCAKPVDWSTPGIYCGNCEIWFHCPRVDIGSLEYDRLGHESQFWDCYRCKSRNNSTIDHAYKTDPSLTIFLGGDFDAGEINYRKPLLFPYPREIPVRVSYQQNAKRSHKWGELGGGGRTSRLWH